MVALGWSLAAAGAGAKEVKVRRSWDGVVKDEKLRKEAPPNGVVTDRKAWAKLWKAWRGGEKVPEVDFDKELALILTCDGPNKIDPPVLLLDGKRGLKVQPPVATLVPGPGFGYKIVTVQREGIKTVNGKPLKTK